MIVVVWIWCVSLASLVTLNYQLISTRSESAGFVHERRWWRGESNIKLFWFELNLLLQSICDLAVIINHTCWMRWKGNFTIEFQWRVELNLLYYALCLLQATGYNNRIVWGNLANLPFISISIIRQLYSCISFYYDLQSNMPSEQIQFNCTDWFSVFPRNGSNKVYL